jgi:O-antigen ligase
MRFLSWSKEHRLELVVGLVAAALPAYLLRFHIGPFPMTGLEVVVLIAIVVVIARSVATKRSPRDCFASLAMTIKTDKLLALGSTLILIATVIGIIVAPDKISALGIAKAYFWEPMALAWLLIAAKPDKEKMIRAALIGFAASASIVIVYGLIQYAFPALIPATWTAERRITSVFDYPNAAALYLAPLAPLFLAIPFGAILTCAIFLIIILAKSAGGLAAAATALFFVGVIKKKTRIGTIIFAALICLIVFFAPQAKGLREQIFMQDWSGRVHRIGWSESWTMLKDHPLFGAGLSGYPTAVAPYHHAQGVEIFQYPHNLFLAAWSELGLIGLIGMVMILVWFFWSAIRIIRMHSQFGVASKAAALAAAIIAILVHGLVDAPYFKNDLAMMFWLFMVLMAHYSQRYESPKDNG